MQKVLVVQFSCKHGIYKSNTIESTKEVNALLEEGWEVTNMTPMGAYGYGAAGGETYEVSSDAMFAAMVLLENKQIVKEKKVDELEDNKKNKVNAKGRKK